MKDDSWKGEALIRAVPRTSLQGKNFHTRGPRSSLPICAVPGCDIGLYAGTVSGVCAKHNHYPEVCRCDSCRKGRGTIKRGYER